MKFELVEAVMQADGAERETVSEPTSEPPLPRPLQLPPGDLMRQRNAALTTRITSVIASVRPALDRLGANVAHTREEVAGSGRVTPLPPEGFRPDRFAPGGSRSAQRPEEGR
ncbi:hypothetical protein J0910_05145 [Nocardiopsis sp. CNT-189]|uniref:hypothetical protein n=1 Tax=Nocardiopsis oceanisediminis TaxID=2816862 RepID=UPI003B2CACED